MRNNEAAFFPIEKLDTNRVIINGRASLSYWMNRFNCSEKDLIEAVQIVGNSAAEVELFLKVERKKNWRVSFN